MKAKYETLKPTNEDGLPTLRSRVAHPQFGEGEVISLNGFGARLKCTVRFGELEATDERKLLWSVAANLGAKVVEKRTLLIVEEDPKAVIAAIEEEIEAVGDVVVAEEAIDEDEE